MYSAGCSGVGAEGVLFITAPADPSTHCFVIYENCCKVSDVPPVLLITQSVHSLIFQTAAVRFNHEEFQRQLVQYLEG